uniref:CPSF_A domain-containing protein n=1 Tax=Macrostomum lignano TaxID=282301 RepID=A0A1I8FBG6_9PLAT
RIVQHSVSSWSRTRNSSATGLDCARKIQPELQGFTVLAEYSMQELIDVYDNFQLQTQGEKSKGQADEVGLRLNGPISKTKERTSDAEAAPPRGTKLSLRKSSKERSRGRWPVVNWHFLVNARSLLVGSNCAAFLVGRTSPIIGRSDPLPRVAPTRHQVSQRELEIEDSKGFGADKLECQCAASTAMRCCTLHGGRRTLPMAEFRHRFKGRHRCGLVCNPGQCYRTLHFNKAALICLAGQQIDAVETHRLELVSQFDWLYCQYGGVSTRLQPKSGDVILISGAKREAEQGEIAPSTMFIGLLTSNERLLLELRNTPESASLQAYVGHPAATVRSPDGCSRRPDPRQATSPPRSGRDPAECRCREKLLLVNRKRGRNNFLSEFRSRRRPVPLGQRSIYSLSEQSSTRRVAGVGDNPDI